MAVGLLLLVAAVLWQLGLVPGSRVTLPQPVALERRAATAETSVQATAVPTSVPVTAATPEAAAAVALPTPRPPTPTATVPAAPPVPRSAAPAAPAVPFVAPDQADRREEAALPVPGYAVRLAIPAIKLDTPVEQAGIVRDDQGAPLWETRPFVAVHYGDLTALVGAHGNAVIAGHVVTRSEGNVFRNLYQVDLGGDVQVWDERDHLHQFEVVDVRLVPPTDTSVMEPTTTRTLTLLTCGGTFDPIKREFSDRLVVVAKPVIKD